MKLLLLSFFILFATVSVGFLFQKDIGYVTIAFQHWVITANLWAALLLLVLMFIVFYTLIRFFKNLFALPHKIVSHHQMHCAHKKQSLFMEALSCFIEGCYDKAERQAVQSISKNTSSHLNYLLAAFSADAQQADDRRNKYLLKAQQKNGQYHFVIATSQAVLFMKHQQYDAALVILKQLYDEQLKNTLILKYLSRAYLMQEKWHDWLSLLPELRKHSILSESDLYLNEVRAYQHQFPEQTAELIETILRKQWAPALLHFYVTDLHLSADVLAKKIDIAESWLKKHPHDAALITTLARLYAQGNFPGKAGFYAEKAFSENPDAQSFAILACIFETLGDKDKAIMCYRRGYVSR